MSSFKKVLTGTAAVATALIFVGTASANVSGGAPTQYIASATTTPLAATAFTNSGSNIVVDGTAQATFAAPVATANHPRCGYQIAYALSGWHWGG